MVSNSWKAVVAFMAMSSAAAPVHSAEHRNKPAPIIEVVTLRLKDGVSPAHFAHLDQQVEQTYIRKRPGFLSRESAPGSNHNWLVIVHWRSTSDAKASMKSFATAPAAAEFMAMIVPNSMVMKRYGQ